MSDTAHRPPPRGRGSSSRGRGGFGGRGGGARPNRNGTTNGDATHDKNGTSTSGADESADLKELRTTYKTQLAQVKGIFPDWQDEDLLYALQDSEGSVESVAEKIADGKISTWGQVPSKKDKDRARSKAKEPGDDRSRHRHSRGDQTRGRAREGRENRGGGRGRGGGRAAAPATNGSAHPVKDDFTAAVDNDPSADEFGTTASDTAEPDKPADGPVADDDWGAPAEAPKPASRPAPPTNKSSLIPAGSTKSWASMLKPAPVVKKAPPPPAVKPTAPPVEEPVEPAKEPVVPSASPKSVESKPFEDLPSEPSHVIDAEPVQGAPLELTEENLEQVEDVSPPAVTQTVAATVASPAPPKSSGDSVSGLPSSGLVPATPNRPAAGAMQTPKSGIGGRISSYQRRMLDQQEGVVMPRDHMAATAVQFGSLGLDGADVGDEIEPEREEPETVKPLQPPSPVGHPVTTLPPAAASTTATTSQPSLPPAPPAITSSESIPIPTPRQAPGLPQPPTIQGSPAALQQLPSQLPVGSQPSQIGSGLDRFTAQSAGQKYESPFSQPIHPTQPQVSSTSTSLPSHTQQPPTGPPGYSSFPQHTAAHQPNLPTPTAHPSQSLSGLGGMPSDYSNFYQSEPQGRYGAYGYPYNQPSHQQHQPVQQSAQEAGQAQQRAASGLGGSTDTPSHLHSSGLSSQQSQSAASRFGAGDSGHATPSPGIPSQSQPQHGAGHMYPSQIPPQFYPYYYQQQQYGYGAYQHPYSKGGMFPPAAGGFMSPAGYGEHASGPGALGGFGAPSSQGQRDLSEYSRPSNATHQQSSGGFSALSTQDLFARANSSQNQLGGVGSQQQGNQNSQSEDSLKPYDTKAPSGPSGTPSLQQGPGRPGSATSGNMAQGNQSLGQQQQMLHQQQQLSGYPSHLQQQQQMGGHHGHQGTQQSQHNLGGQGQGLGGQSSQHQPNAYGMYGGSNFNAYPQYGGGSSGRGAGNSWGGYGAH